MSIKLAVVMDPIAKIKPYKDTTFALLLAAQKLNWDLTYLQVTDIFLKNELVYAQGQQLSVIDNNNKWFELTKTSKQLLTSFDVVLMRKDPPFNLQYLMTTYLLEMAQQQGALVINNPQGLRNFNEKLFALKFPQCCPPTLVSCDHLIIREFIDEHEDVIIKPLDSMGGASVFHLRHTDDNINVTIELLTQLGQRQVMLQRFIKQVTEGDKRIIMVDGEAVSHALVRLPAAGEIRANLVAGGRGICQLINDHDRWICQQVGAELRDQGLLLVGLDVIGDYLTEINITSPTCVREIEAQSGIDICSQILNAIEKKIGSKNV